MSWLRPFEQRPAASRHLICFPYGGASASAYREWAQDAPGLQAHAVQYPGRGDRFTEPLVVDVREAARHVAAEAMPLADRPVALFGHSLGAYLAYETALVMAAGGRPACLLVVSGARAPHDPAREQERYANLQDDDFLEVVRQLGGTDHDLLADADLRDLMLPILRADFRAAENYAARPAPSLTCPMVCMLGGQDPLTGQREAGLWAAACRGGFTFCLFQGGHFFPWEHRRRVIRTVLDHLADVEVGHGR